MLKNLLEKNNIEKNQVIPTFLALGILIFGAVLVLGGIFLAFKVFSLSVEVEQLDQLNRHLEGQKQALRNETLVLKTDVITLEEMNEGLREDLEKEIRDVDRLIDRLEEVTGEVETIKRLEELDPELLKKYSRVYFLNENYEPSGLTKISEEFLAPTREEGYFHEEAWPILREMMEDARSDGVYLKAVSGYRSFDEQMELKGRYDMIFGAGTANEFSAYQGYSEHQLGTAVDFSTSEMKGVLDGFEKTNAYVWLKKNAYKYGFVLSYPEGNQYYQFEPWHWRFVGIELATDLHERGMYFYDMDQREIDKYRLYIFDY